MAKFAHTITYRIDGSGPVRETVIMAESVSLAKEKFQDAFPNGKIEKVLTTVPSKS
jgi:hypothetical protein